MVPPRVQDAAAVTLQDAYVYEPESEPLEQLRVCDAQDCPYGTVDAWYAVADDPFAIEPPHGSPQGWYTVSDAPCQPSLPPDPCA